MEKLLDCKYMLMHLMLIYNARLPDDSTVPDDSTDGAILGRQSFISNIYVTQSFIINYTLHSHLHGLA